MVQKVSQRVKYSAGRQDVSHQWPAPNHSPRDTAASARWTGTYSISCRCWQRVLALGSRTLIPPGIVSSEPTPFRTTGSKTGITAWSAGTSTDCLTNVVVICQRFVRVVYDRSASSSGLLHNGGVQHRASRSFNHLITSQPYPY